MVSIDTFIQMAMSLPGTAEYPHFRKKAFKTKKIFATLDVEKQLACIMLSPVDQSVFSSYDKKIIYPAPNKWGLLHGATYFELKTVRKNMLKDALQLAYELSLETPQKKTKK